MGEGLEEVPYVNPFPPLTDAWAVHDTVLEIMAVLDKEVGEEGFMYKEISVFNTWFDFIGATLDMTAREVMDAFQRALLEPFPNGIAEPVEITDRLFEEAFPS